MCGLAGVVDLRRISTEDALHTEASAMATVLQHRGPDDAGVWVSAADGVALGFRRLSIHDLSPAGHQPMASDDASLVLAFNGEIYNYRSLRRELEGVGRRFRGTSDTEVVLAAVERWGINDALRRFNGMFALVVWDRRAQTLHLARDRFGEKPLYVAAKGDRILFASELKAIAAHPRCPRLSIDRSVLASYLRWGHVPEPWSIFAGVEKVAAGTRVAYDLRGGTPSTTRSAFFDAHDELVRAAREPFAGSLDESADALDDALRESVGLRLDADVPLGAFLSGGVDSSMVVAMAQDQSARPLTTFTIGFHETDFDEAADAARVARHLGTDHHQLYVSAAEARAVIPRLPTLYDEPFADASAVPTVLVAELARRDVTVALSGDGGDELFGGYNRYVQARRLWHRFDRLGAPGRRALAGAVAAVPRAGWDRAIRFGRALPGGQRLQGVNGDRVHRAAELLGQTRPDDVYRSLLSVWKHPAEVVIGAGGEVATSYNAAARWTDVASFADRMMLADTLGYLPGDILTKVDRATMAVSLEARVPMLDPAVARLAWRLPDEHKLAGAGGKLVLKQLLSRYLPRSLWDRPKTGFGIPLDSWLRGELRPWAEELLAERRLRDDGFFDPAPVREMWRQHTAEERDAGFYLWNVLVFGAWLEQQPEAVT